MSFLSDAWTGAQTVHGEARGEPDESALGVAWVLCNRARLRIKGESVRDCALAPWQFSCWNKDDPNLPVIAKASLEDSGFQRSYSLMVAAMTRTIPDPTGGSTDYHTVGITPDWAKDYIPTIRLGQHVFYRRT